MVKYTPSVAKLNPEDYYYEIVVAIKGYRGVPSSLYIHNVSLTLSWKSRQKINNLIKFILSFRIFSNYKLSYKLSYNLIINLIINSVLIFKLLNLYGDLPSNSNLKYTQARKNVFLYRFCNKYVCTIFANKHKAMCMDVHLFTFK